MEPVDQPALSVVLPAPHGPGHAMASIEANVRELATVGGELVVVDPTDDDTPLPDGAVRVRGDSNDAFALAATGLQAARGRIIGIGEDHARPQPGWAKDIIAAHERHPEAAAVCCALVNATDRTLCGRVNFLSFAAPWTGASATLSTERPPPTSTLTVKRSALDDEGYEGSPREFEVVLLNRWLALGRIVPAFDIGVDHFQDHGWRWTVRNAFVVTRDLFGELGRRQSPEQRRATNRHTVREFGPRLLREVRGHPDAGPAELAGCVLLAATRVLGALIGTRFGPTRKGTTDTGPVRRSHSPSVIVRTSLSRAGK